MSDARPNVLLITTDQQRFDTIAALGNPCIDTPHLDWLVDEGITFTRAYADCPVCMPSRTTLMTGLSGASLGMTGNDPSVYPLPHHATLPALLAASGYQTHAQGKMHFRPIRARYGFESMELPLDYYRERRRLSTGDASMPKQHGVGENEMQAVISTVAATESLTHWTVKRTIDAIETRDPTRPFFLWTSFTKPHPPFDPPPSFWSLYQGRTVPAPTYGDWSQDVDTIPHDLLAPTYLLNNAHRMSAESLQQSMRAYYACITHIDYELGLLFARMREMDLLANTWIIFTSDHGEMLGDHHMGGKSLFFEGSAHVPLIVRPPADPWVRHPDGNRRITTIVSLADVVPTILARAGVPASPITTPDGADLLTYCKQADHKRDLVGECGDIGAVITQRFSYHYCAGGAVELLFDHQYDPMQRHNLAGQPEHAALQERLRRRLVTVLEQRRGTLVHNGQLREQDPMRGPSDVARWPGFHSLDVASDVLH